MKKQIVLLLAIGVSFISFSQTNRVLTEEERQILLLNTTFLEKCQWAARNYASFWSVDTGSGATTETLKIKWAKDRITSVGIIKNGINDQHIVESFLNAAKSKQYSLFASPQSASTLIAAWDSASSFDEFVSAYFDIISDNIDFKIGN